MTRREYGRQWAARWRDSNPGLCAKKMREWRAKNRERMREINRKHNYRKNFGISIHEYNQLLTQQGGGCCICGKSCTSGRNLAIDHCHSTGQIRGLLCSKCNQAIGLLQDSPELCYAASVYLTQQLKVA